MSETTAPTGGSNVNRAKMNEVKVQRTDEDYNRLFGFEVLNAVVTIDDREIDKDNNANGTSGADGASGTNTGKPVHVTAIASKSMNALAYAPIFANRSVEGKEDEKGYLEKKVTTKIAEKEKTDLAGERQ